MLIYSCIIALFSGLFNKAIIQSDFGNTYYGSKRNLPKLGFKLGEKLGFNEKDPEKLVEFLKKQPADEICKQAMAVLADISKVSFSKIALYNNQMRVVVASDKSSAVRFKVTLI